jgi:hypothetical protein
MILEGYNFGQVDAYNKFIVSNDSLFRKFADAKNFMNVIDLPISLKFMILQLADISNNRSFPVILPVNPDDFKVNYKKKITIDYVAGGFVTNFWHDDIIDISAAGYIPSFQSRAKILTDSYAHFRELLDVYTKCGKVQPSYRSISTTANPDDSNIEGQTLSVPGSSQGTTPLDTSSGTVTPGTNADTATMLSAQYNIQYVKVFLIYQHEQFEGVFNSFSVHETYEMPNTLQYSFDFKAFSKTDLDSFLPSELQTGLRVSSDVLNLGASFAGASPDDIKGR